MKIKLSQPTIIRKMNRPMHAYEFTPLNNVFVPL